MSTAHKPLRPGARIIWTLVTLASFAWCAHSYITFLSH